MYDKHREDANSGELVTGHGTVRFAEDYYGEYFYFDVYDSVLNENKRIMLSTAEIYAFAKAGVLTEVVDLNALDADVQETERVMREREKELEKIRSVHDKMMPSSLEADYDAAHADLPGGDGAPDYYSVEGWGIQKLDNGDFEVKL